MMALKLQEMYKEQYHPRRNEFTKSLPRDSFNKTNQINEGGSIHNPWVTTYWQHPPPMHPPMNWIPMAQFPIVKPLGPQSIHLQRPAWNSNIANHRTQGTAPNQVKPSQSYKQAMVNQQGPNN